jgi:hypothetical protein
MVVKNEKTNNAYPAALPSEVFFFKHLHTINIMFGKGCPPKCKEEE